MRGMTVLDVGSATGFFAFEFERRGAEVVSVELPSIADWDMPQGPEREETLARLMRGHGVSSIEELTKVHLHGPFEVCRMALGSKVSRCYSRVYDLTAARLGHDAFDMIFAGDILLHTFSPLAALAALAPLCRDLLVVSQMLASGDAEKPLMLFTGGTRDHRTWWHPNRRCLEQMLERVGFTSMELVGQHSPLARGGQWVVKNEAVFHARKLQR
jgi:hypothetical protein